jgi:tetratricopeptide (TPR) repeat protein
LYALFVVIPKALLYDIKSPADAGRKPHGFFTEIHLIFFPKKGFVRMDLRLAVLLLFVIMQNAVASKTSIAVFPLRNESAGELHEWIGYGIAETMARKLRSLEGFRVWDPVFLFRTDSSGAGMTSDSILKRHRDRWQWDVAIGGKYSVVADSLHAEFRLLWATGREEPLRVEIKLSRKAADFFPLCNEALFKILRTLRHRISPRDSLALLRGIPYDFAAYRTYVSGYGYEMRGDQNAALTAYARVEEMDPRCAAAVCREGMLYQHSNDFGRAREAFERADARGPDDPDIAAAFADFLAECDAPAKAFKYMKSHRALLEKTSAGMKAMGQMYSAAGEFERAMALLTKAVAFGPSDLEVEFALGSVYSSAGDFSRASEIFNHLILYRPDYLRYYASLGGAYRKVGRLMEATMVLESAYKIAPDNTTILIDLAHTYIMLGWYEKAGQALLRAREIAPLLSDIDVNLGVVYWYQGKNGEAARCFEAAGRTATTSQAALNNLGTMLFLGGSPGKAISAYAKADKTGHKNEMVLYNLAIACLREKKLKKAARYLDEVLQLSPDRIDVLVQLASIAVTLGRDDDAERSYHKIVEILPDHVAAIRGIVSILVREKRYEEALQPVEDILERQPLNREFMTLLASIYEKMGWYEAALMKYQTILKTFPDDANGYLGVGTCMYAMIKYRSLQSYDNAILALKQAGEHVPDNPEPDMLIGDIYADYKGYRELAVDHWKKALNKASDRRMKKALERKIAEKK